MCNIAGACALLPCTLTRRGSMRKCAHAYAHILGTCELRLRMLRSWGKFRFINTDREACATEQEHVHYCLALSHAGEARANVRMQMHIFRGKYNSLETWELLVRMFWSSGKIQVYQHRWRSMCTRAAEGAILSCTLTRHMRKCAHAYAHIQTYVH